MGTEELDVKCPKARKKKSQKKHDFSSLDTRMCSQMCEPTACTVCGHFDFINCEQVCVLWFNADSERVHL